MNRRLWYGFLDEGNGKGSVVVYDRLFSPISNSEVLLFNFKKNSISSYKKNKVRAKLRSIAPDEQSVIFAVTGAYYKALSSYRAMLKDKKSTSSGYLSYIVPHDIELQERYEEMSHDMDSWERSDDSGWFYGDVDGDWVDNTIDPKSN